MFVPEGITADGVTRTVLAVVVSGIGFAGGEFDAKTGAPGAGLAAPADSGVKDVFVALALAAEFARLSKPERCKTTSPPPAIAKHTPRAAIPTIRFGDFRASCSSVLMI
jgi:hypothetical protein